MKNTSLLASIALVTILTACGGDNEKDTQATASQEPQSMVAEAPSYDPNRGEGKWTEENVNVGETINEEWAAAGERNSSVKCASCHKYTAEKLVGPGWAGVTQRRTPAWIMNFITNPDPMIDKDPEAQAMLELCLVRMPNQNLTDAEARNILEFMRKNDGVK